MNTKTLLLIPAALALCAPGTAKAHVGFGLNLSLPLYYPVDPYYYPPTGYVVNTVTYAPTTSVQGEQVAPQPGPGYVWIAGHWNNVSQKWVWVAGHWEMPPSPSASWIPGHWVRGNDAWVWVDATWSVGNASSQPPGPPPTPPSSPATPGAQAPASAQPAQVSPPPPAPATAASAEVAEGTVVTSEPPAPIVEVIPACPYPDYVWVGGYWGWRNGWYWVPGRYAPPPYRGAVWLSAGWFRGGHGWAFRGGHWR